MKSTESEKERIRKLQAFLRGLPHLAFTHTGVANIAKRFELKPEQIVEAVDALIVERAKKQPL